MEQQTLEPRAYEREGVIVNPGDVIVREIKVTEGRETRELVTAEAGEAIVRQGESLEEGTAIETLIR